MEGMTRSIGGQLYEGGSKSFRVVIYTQDKPTLFQAKKYDFIQDF
jgi:hypothetical protein